MIEFPSNPAETVYIDRAEYRDNILALIETGHQKNIALGDTHAIYGTGKTTTLSKLYYDLKEQGKWTPIWLPLNYYSIMHTNEKIQDYLSLDGLKQNLDDYKRLLIDLGNQIDPQAFEGLPRKMIEIADKRFENIFKFDISAQGGEARVGALAKVVDRELKGGDVKIEVSIHNQEKILEYILDTKRRKITEEFLEIFKPISQRRLFVIFADDFCWIIDQKIGTWLLKLLVRMENTFTLISRTITNSALKWKAHRLQSLYLRPFTLEETQKYLAKRCLNPTDQQLEKIYEYSRGGHPLLVSLVGDFLCRLDRRSAQNVDQLLNKLAGASKTSRVSTLSPGESDEKEPIDMDALTTSIDRIIVEQRKDIRKYDPALLPGLDILAVARDVDRELIEYMFTQFLAGEKVESQLPETALSERAGKIANDMVNRMGHYSIIQQCKRGERDFFHLHCLVREQMEANLAKERSPAYLERLHNLLANYYGSKESDYLQNQGEYSRMFRLENSAWQADMIEWLYHLFRLKDRNKALLQLTRFYLEAFDWWGWYIAFDFCDDLLAAWGQTQPAEDVEFLSYLSDFQRAYPLGYEKEGQGSWAEVHKALQNIKLELKLNIPADKMSADQRMVRGHLDRFIAEAYRFHVPKESKRIEANYKRAEAFYRSSLQYFEPEWNRMWIINYLADLFLDWARLLDKAGEAQKAGERYAQAEEQALTSNRMALDEEDFLDQDHELVSQNYRILGDIRLFRGQLAESVQTYNRQIVHAYIFHFMEDNRDDYSFKFYTDTGEHVLNRLTSLAQEGRLAAARQACEFLRSFWEENAGFDYAHEILTDIQLDFDLEESLKSARVDQLKEYIFPRLPEVGVEGDPIETGVAVSQYLAVIVEDDQLTPELIL
jgi:hypothetical protein